VRIARAFEEPIVIIASWMVLIIGIISASHLIGTKMPTTGAFGGAGDLMRNA
jgi:hypothetical protein